jgi:chromatin remodeling complex protein RSC6
MSAPSSTNQKKVSTKKTAAKKGSEEVATGSAAVAAAAVAEVKAVAAAPCASTVDACASVCATTACDASVCDASVCDANTTTPCASTAAYANASTAACANASTAATAPCAVPSSDAEVKHESCCDLVEQCVKQAQAQINSCREIVATIREVKKAHVREMRDMEKSSKKSRRQKSTASKQLTGFAKPCKISDQLADFLKNVAGNADVTRDMEMSRTEATRRLNQYFINHNLRDDVDKRIILYEKDPKLVALLGSGVTKGEKLTYFNLQSALKDKFTKPVSVSPVTASTATSVAV